MFSKQIHFDHFLISDQGGYTMPERSCKKRVPLNFFIQNFVERKSTHGKSDETVRYFFGDLSSITALSTNPSLSLSLAATKPPQLLLPHVLENCPSSSATYSSTLQQPSSPLAGIRLFHHHQDRPSFSWNQRQIEFVMIKFQCLGAASAKLDKFTSN